MHAGDDVELFLNEAVVYVEDDERPSLSQILKKLLILMKQSDIDISHNSIEAIKNEIFRHRHSGDNALLGQSVQGYIA